MKRNWIRLLLLVPAGLAPEGCSHSAASQPSFRPPLAAPREEGVVTLGRDSLRYVEVSKVEAATDSYCVHAPARVSFRDGAMSPVGAPIAGRVVDVHVKIGDRIHTGDPLVTLKSPDAAAARSALATAIARHEAADLAAKRQALMMKAGVGIESERIDADSHLKEAEAELVRARNAASYLGEEDGQIVVVRAPIDGTVLSRRVTQDMYASPGGEPLMEIGDSSAVWVIADVFERDLPLIQEGAAVDIDAGTVPGALHGHVASIGSVLNVGLRRAPVYVALDDSEARLRPGLFARATIKGCATQVIELPASAVLIKDGRKYVVYVKEGDGAFARREITVGPSIDGKVQVVSGLQPGDEVAVKGALLLDGASEQLL